jgi:hypothetical protein
MKGAFMENEKIEFADLYENFTGSGNINGKYWIVGLEPGGEVNLANPEDETVKVLNSNNIFNVLEYFNDFNQETGNRGFLGLEKKLLTFLNLSDFHISKYSNNKEYFNYPRYGDVFRTNMFPLPLPDDKHETFLNKFPLYDKYFYFDLNFKEKYKILLFYKSLRISKIKSFMKEKPKFIFILYKKWGEGFINDFFNGIFEDTFEKEKPISKIDLFRGKHESSPLISVIPQRIADRDLNSFVESYIL